MKIEFSYTREEIKAVWNYFRGYTTISICNARVLYIAVPTISFVLFLIGIYSGLFWLQTQGSLFLFASVVGIPIHVALDKWRFSTWYRNNFMLEHGKVNYIFIANDEGLILANSDSVETRIPWNAITDFRQNEVITVMSLSPDNCIYFPTKAMTGEQRAEFDEFVARHVIRRKP
ncbi:MAG: YcxB family protein [Terracidiphilus sp.]